MHLKVWTRAQEMQGLGRRDTIGLRKASAWSSFCEQGFLHASLCYLWLSQRASLLYSKTQKRGFDSVFFCPISFIAEDKVPANKQSLPQLDLLLSDFCIWTKHGGSGERGILQIQWFFPQSWCCCLQEFIKLLWYLCTSSKVPNSLSLFGKGNCTTVLTPLRAAEMKLWTPQKQSDLLMLLFLSEHPTPPSLVLDSEVLQCSSLLGKGRDPWKGESVSQFCFSFLKTVTFSYPSDPPRALAGHQMCFDGIHGLDAGRRISKPPKPTENSPQRVSFAFMFPWSIFLFKGETLFASCASITSAFPQYSKVILILGVLKPTVLPIEELPYSHCSSWLTHIPCPPAPADLPFWDLCWHPASPFRAPPTPPHPSHINWNPSGTRENSSLKGFQPFHKHWAGLPAPACYSEITTPCC